MSSTDKIVDLAPGPDKVLIRQNHLCRGQKIPHRHHVQPQVLQFHLQAYFLFASSWIMWLHCRCYVPANGKMHGLLPKLAGHIGSSRASIERSVSRIFDWQYSHIRQPSADAALFLIFISAESVNNDQKYKKSYKIYINASFRTHVRNNYSTFAGKIKYYYYGKQFRTTQVPICYK